MRIRDENNASVAEVVFDARKMFGAPSILVKRSALAVELTRLSTDPSLPGTPATIVRGRKVTHIDVVKGTATLADGTTFTADVIVGADGINSIVRAAIQSAQPALTAESASVSPRPSSLLAYVCSVPREMIAADPDLAFQADVESAAGLTTYVGPGGRDVAPRVGVYPINATHFQVVGYFPETTWTETFDKSMSSIIRDVPSARAVEDFKDFHPSIGRLFRYVRDLSLQLPQ